MSDLTSTRARLQRLDVCSVSDALDQLQLPAAVSGIAPRTARKRISGQVLTVRLAAGPPPQGTPPKHLCTQAIEQAEAGDVIVVEQRTGIDCAGWGGLLSRAALFKALSGAIVEGSARDLDEAADLGFCVFARGQTARTARGRVHEAETGGAIRVGDALVNAGDWVVADSSGIAFIPQDRLAQVIAAAERIVQREALMSEAVLSGQPASEVMGANYEAMLTNAATEGSQ